MNGRNDGVPLYCAHVRTAEDTGSKTYQSVEEHLRGCAALSADFAQQFGARAAGELAGLSHDIGKCTKTFQDRILRGGPRVDHASAGAVACAKRGQWAASVCVLGHHTGLPDYGNAGQDRAGDPTYFGRMHRAIEGRYLEACGDPGVSLPECGAETAEPDALRRSFWIRMLYSCLVDADYLDTERFMSGGTAARGGYASMPELLARLEAYIAPWQNPQTELNRMRCRILQSCLAAGEKPRGLYTLTVPTGGGKTVASLAFALRHCVAHGMQRVIYVIPYTSIIEQNAQVFRNILGAENVLEHHSGVQYDAEDGASPAEYRRALAAENWDSPVVVTTAVQFFESLYANRSSRCRKLHNLANSVVILDEAQMLPTAHLRPCVAAIASLAAQFSSTVVLCTATQPALDDLLHAYAPQFSVRELCPPELCETEAFRRVRYRRAGVLSDEALADELAQHKRVLCVVNSRRAAQKLYALLPEEGRIHLSTQMVPAHRQALFSEIRRRLKDGQVCRVVSTSLIEAGVDIDFPTVYRELVGLDSVWQAAGRCNREGKRSPDESVVTVFERTETPPKIFGIPLGAARTALSVGETDQPQTMRRYFTELRALSGDNLDKADVVRSFSRGVEGCEMPFRYVAENFRLIDNATRTIYIPWGEGNAWIERLKHGECSRALYRALGRYAVSVYENQYQALYSAGALLTAAEVPGLDSGSAILCDTERYSDKTGLSSSLDGGEGFFV